MSQVNYDEQGKSLDGMLGDIGPNYKRSGAAEGAVPFGRFTTKGTDAEKQVRLPALAVEITGLKNRRGVALQSHANENLKNGLSPRYVDKKTVSFLSRGTVFVKVEDAVDTDDNVFVRFQNGDEGLFRSDAGGGTAQVNTNTVDSAANATLYTTYVNGVPYSILSDGDATLTEIKDALIVAINLGAEPVTAVSTGADEYSLTADVAGVPFSNTVDANQSIVLTTANALGNAAELPNAKWLEAADAGDFALLELL